MYRLRSSSCGQAAQVGIDVGRVDGQRRPGLLAGVERHRLEQPLHDRVQPARADVLGALVDLVGDLGDAPHAAGVELERDVLGAQQRAGTARSARRPARSGCARNPRPSASPARRGSGSGPAAPGSGPTGLLMWNAPLAMNSTWSVFSEPYLVATVQPSTSGSRSRCTPSRDTSAPMVSWRRAILSISSMNTMPFCSALATARARSSSSLTSLAASSSTSSFSASRDLHAARAACAGCRGSGTSTAAAAASPPCPAAP